MAPKSKEQNYESEGSVISDDKCQLVCFCILPKTYKNLATHTKKTTPPTAYVV